MDNESAREMDGVQPLLTCVEIASYCRVDWARVGKDLRFVAQVDRPRGIYLHWRAGGSLLCPVSVNPTATCELCVDPKVKKGWYALTLGRCWNTHDTVLALLPEVSFHRAERRLLKESLHGRLLSYSRTTKTSTVSVEVTSGRNIIPVPKINPEEFTAIVEHVYSRMLMNQRKERSE